MAHRFPIAEIIESWGGNYTVQAEVVLSKYHYHQIRMKGWRGLSTWGWRRPRGEASQHTFLTPSSVSMSPTLLPPTWVSPTSHWHKQGEGGQVTEAQPFISERQAVWWRWYLGVANRRSRKQHKRESMLSAEVIGGSYTSRYSVFFGRGLKFQYGFLKSLNGKQIGGWLVEDVWLLFGQVVLLVVAKKKERPANMDSPLFTWSYLSYWHI